MYFVSPWQRPGIAFMLCCDDTVRENVDAEKTGRMYDLCEEFDGCLPP